MRRASAGTCMKRVGFWQEGRPHVSTSRSSEGGPQQSREPGAFIVGPGALLVGVLLSLVLVQPEQS